MQQRFAVWVILMMTAASLAYAQKVAEFPVSRDITVFSNSAGKANGSGVHFISGNTNNGHARRTIVQFEMGPLDADLNNGSTIQSAPLALNVNKGKDGQQNFTIYPPSPKPGVKAAKAPTTKPGSGAPPFGNHCCFGK